MVCFNTVLTCIVAVAVADGVAAVRSTDTIALHDAADRIVVAVRSADFGSRLVNALDDAGRTLDGNQINRFGWLFNEDIEVTWMILSPAAVDLLMHFHFIYTSR